MVKIKQKEAKRLKFTVKDAEGTSVDLCGAKVTFGIKTSKLEDAFVILKTDANFDKTDETSGILYINLSETDLDIADKKYIAELKIYFNANNINKSKDIVFKVEKAVITT